MGAAEASVTGIVVCDAGPLIHLDELGSLDLLSDFPRVLIPSGVWREVLGHRPGALKGQFEETECPLAFSGEIEAVSRLLTLHRGEKEALQLAMEHPGSILLTDDSAARLAAVALRVPVRGTVGILLRSVRRKQKTKDEVANILRALPSTSTLHIQKRLLQEIIEQLEP